MEELTNWIGRKRETHDKCALPLARRVAALLDADPEALHEGDTLPQGWQICVFTPRTPQSELREDGHAQEDPLLPPPPLPRRMLGGRRCSYEAPLPIGAALRRVDEITAVDRKQGSKGEMVIITTRHTIHLGDEPTPLLVEEQDNIFRAAAAAGSASGKGPEPVSPVPTPQFSALRATEPTLLFRYSAVVFNTHRIHYDLPYVTGVEGYPGLIVNGGLMTLLLMDLFRREIGTTLTQTESRNRAAAFGGQVLKLCGAEREEGWLLWVEEAESGRLIMEMRAR